MLQTPSLLSLTPLHPAIVRHAAMPWQVATPTVAMINRRPPPLPTMS